MLLEEKSLAENLVADLFERGGEVEIGLDTDGRRWTLVLFDEELESERTELTKDDVWIVSGGGSGVTAACVVELCQANPDGKALSLIHI